MSLTLILSIAGAAVVAALTAIWRAYAVGTANGENKQLVEKAKAREQNLDRIKDAAAARPAGGVLDDPNNRDNR